jgi:hypothetical protein
MTATPVGSAGPPTSWGQQSTAGRAGQAVRGITEPGRNAGGEVRERGTRGRTVAPFADRISERHQVVLVGRLGKRTGVANQFPASRGGDTARVADTQIPGMRLTHRGQWADNRRGIRIDERQRRDCIVRAPGPAAATGNIHGREAIVRKRRPAPDTRSRPAPDL